VVGVEVNEEIDKVPHSPSRESKHRQSENNALQNSPVIETGLQGEVEFRILTESTFQNAFMTTQAQTIVDQVLSLPVATQQEVLTHLIESLDADSSLTAVPQVNVDAAWNEEIAKRVAEVHNGTAELLDGEASLEKIRSKYGV
jgi:hypothetical protein